MTWTNLFYLAMGLGVLPCYRSLRWGLREMKRENESDQCWSSIMSAYEDTL